MLRFASPVAALSLLAVLIGVASADPARIYRKKGDWVSTMLATRAAVQKAAAQSPAVKTEMHKGAQVAEKISIDISAWNELWLITEGNASVVWGDPVLIDADGKATSLTKLKWFTDPGKKRYAKNRSLSRGKLQIGDEQFKQGLATKSAAPIAYKLDEASRYVRFEVKVGIGADRKGGTARFIVAPEGPPEEAVWKLIAADFPEEATWMNEDMRNKPHQWLAVEGEGDARTEWRLISTNLQRCGTYGEELAARYNQLRKDKAPDTDPEWLRLYVQTRRLRNATDNVFQISATLKPLGEHGRELAARHREMMQAKLPPADLQWKELADQADQLSRAVRTIKSFNPEALRRAIADLSKTYPDRYPNGKKYLARLAEIEKEVAAGNVSGELAVAALQLQHDALLSNPLLDFDKLLVRRAKNAGLVNNWISNCSRKKGDYGNDIAVLSPVKPQGKLTTLLEAPGGSFIGDIDLHWNAKKMLLTALGSNNRWQIFEAGTDGSKLTQVTPGTEADVDNAEACYLPDGGVLFGSTATMAGVPCVGGKVEVANLYRLEADRKTVRQLTFEQDQDWCPTVLRNGRVMYLRWEYTDAPHYFTRVLMTMNPDGSGQTSHYGSNSFWPNSLFFARPVPNHPTRFVGVISGHHGVAKMGELVLFDPAQGRHEADGAVQRIPGYGKPVEPIIRDGLVNSSWPKFLHPWPLNEKYFLVAMQPTNGQPWGIYLVDVFDNMLLLKEEAGTGLFEPIPLVERPVPPALSPRVDLKKKTAVVYLSDVHFGPGLKDVPRGTVKRLRIFNYTYGYRGIGGHAVFGMESSWDSKRILGTVPVHEDGSVSFRIPANTPISIQPLDEQGRALQLMRSWMVAMPGEIISCVGCHEHPNSVPPSRQTYASTDKPSAIEPWHGPARAFSFDQEVQPVLDKYCAGCHDGKEPGRPNFADNSPGPRGFSNSYHALHGYVRRPGPESDYHLLRPLEYHVSTSELFQMLQKGHHNVKLGRDAWETLYCWADLNVPYYGTWSEVAAGKSGKPADGCRIDPVAARHRELRRLYAFSDEHAEADAARPTPDRPKFIKPEPEKPDNNPPPPKVASWPFDAKQAKQRQAAGVKQITRTIDLGDGLKLTLVRIPAGAFVMGDAACGDADEKPLAAVKIDKPFWMATTETTNALFGRFFPDHDSRYIDQQWKDHTLPGYAANLPQQPVIRVSWNEAVAFCAAISRKTGVKFTLPSEAQWEWACRAGADTPLSFGGLDADFTPHANLADESLRLFVVKGVNPKATKHEDFQAFIPRAVGLNDGQMIAGDVGSYQPNAWGLHDMHGSVAEWTLSDYKAYPYRADDGRNAGAADTKKVVRGGSWRDRPQRARSGFRLAYPAWQKVFNVGFRVVTMEPIDSKLAEK